MNDFFEKNTALLRSRFPGMPGLPHPLPPHIRVRNTVSGHVTLYYGKLLIHSTYDPVREARAWAQPLRPGDSVCAYGFGLGYHLESVLERIGPKGTLVAIELNPELLSAAMRLRDQTPLLAHPGFHLIHGTEEETVAGELAGHMARLQETAGSGLEVLFHSPSYKCMPEHFPRLSNALEVLLMERRFPAVLGNLEKENYTCNQTLVAQSPGILSLRNAYPDRPALLVSAGPSLDNVLPYLKRIADRMLLTCVDTALPILTRAGLSPEYVFSLDPQEESFRHFIDDLKAPARLIFTPTANTRIVHCYHGEKFVVFKENHSLFGGQEPLLQAKGTTRSGGSVSCLGLDCLIQFGCNPILLAGQDFAFSGKRNYSRHSNYNLTLLDQVGAGGTLAAKHQEYAGGKKQIEVAGDHGRAVPTNPVMYSYLRTLEKIAGAHPETRIYNLCPLGAQIENVSSLGSVNELMNLFAPQFS